MNPQLKAESTGPYFANHLTGEPPVWEKTGPFNSMVTAVLTEHHTQFLRFLQKRLGDRDEAEDVLQDFYIRVLKKANQIRGKSSIIAWLYVVLKSVLADHFRRKSAERRVHQLMVAEWRAIPPQQEMLAAGEEDFDRIACTCFYRLLPTLKREYADALLRVDLEQRSPGDVARALGITAGNMRVRLHRARRTLKEALERSCQQCRAHDCFDCKKPSETY